MNIQHSNRIFNIAIEHVSNFENPLQVEDMVEEKMTDAMMNFNKAGYDGVTKAWNTVQRDVSTVYMLTLAGAT